MTTSDDEDTAEEDRSSHNESTEGASTSSVSPEHDRAGTTDEQSPGGERASQEDTKREEDEDRPGGRAIEQGNSRDLTEGQLSAALPGGRRTILPESLPNQPSTAVRLVPLPAFPSQAIPTLHGALLRSIVMQDAMAAASAASVHPSSLPPTANANRSELPSQPMPVAPQIPRNVARDPSASGVNSGVAGACRIDDPGEGRVDQGLNRLAQPNPRSHGDDDARQSSAISTEGFVSQILEHASNMAETTLETHRRRLEEEEKQNKSQERASKRPKRQDE